MQHDDPISTIRKHLIATDGQSATAGMKAVEIEHALHRTGYVILPNEIAALFAYIFAQGGVSWSELRDMLCRLGLAEIVPYDPEKHASTHDGVLPGDDFLTYSDRIQAVFAHGSSHLTGTRQ